MSQLVFNGHAHEENEVGIKIDSVNIEDSFSRIIGRTETWKIVGAVKPSATKTLAQKIEDLEAAYKNNTGGSYGDAVFTAFSGSHSLLDADSFSGIKVKAFGYFSGPWKMRTELANRRTFYAVIQAEFRYSRSLYAYRESVTMKGNSGPKWMYMPSQIVAPVYQGLQTSTRVLLIQRGVAVGREGYPTPNSPLWPSLLHGDLNEVEYRSPEQLTAHTDGTNAELFAVSWTYVHEGIVPQTMPPTFNIPTITPST